VSVASTRVRVDATAPLISFRCRCFNWRMDCILLFPLFSFQQRYDQGKGNEMEVEGARSSRKYGDVGLLLDIALWMGQEEMIEHSAPLELVRDFFQSHTIEECQQFFGLLEERAEQFSRAISVGGRAPNTLLRSLSEVRKRLSRTNDLVFAGRILMFMAYAFPLSDKSGSWPSLASLCHHHTTVFPPSAGF